MTCCNEVVAFIDIVKKKKAKTGSKPHRKQTTSLMMIIDIEIYLKSWGYDATNLFSFKLVK